MMVEASTKRVGLWGATQVGKTTLLATALFQDDSPLAPLVRADLSGSVNHNLFDVYRRLMTNQWVVPTAGSLAVRLTGSDGTRIEFVDVSGGGTLEMQDPESRNIVRGLDGVLFFVEYGGLETGSQMLAVDAAMLELGDKPCALALTKCECHLQSESDVWDSPAGWLQDTPLWSAHQRTLQKFEGRAWPTSAFGYDEATGLPAVILGEMGQLLPFRIQPRNVAHPLAWVLNRLGCL